MKSTIKGPSKFKQGLNYEKITKEAWDNGAEVSNGKTWKVFKADDVIGASSGKETEYMRVELTGQTKELHSSPITKEEYQRLTKKE